MESRAPSYETIDDYIATFPEHIQTILREMRAAITEAAPDAEERISYRMPTFYLQGNLVHFAAHTRHIGFYPGPSAVEAFSPDLAAFESSKGAIRFPIDRPLPLELIGRIVRFRVDENLRNAESRRGRRKPPKG